MNSIHNRAEEIVLAELVYCLRGGNAMILEAMYNGSFIPVKPLFPSLEYRKAIQTCAALMEQLSQRPAKRTMLWWRSSAQNAIAQCGGK